MLTEAEFAALIVRSFKLDERAVALDEAARSLVESLQRDIEAKAGNGELRALFDRALAKAEARGVDDPTVAAVGAVLLVQARRVAAYLAAEAISARLLAQRMNDAAHGGEAAPGAPEGAPEGAPAPSGHGEAKGAQGGAQGAGAGVQ